MHELPESVIPDLTSQGPRPEAANDSAPAAAAFTFSFTGSGKEYFRIWIVNLLLTVATLGIYSAWAKVRRLQYFDRNTRLAGAVFDFRGDPKAVLRGRLLAVVLLASYHYAFGFSMTFGLIIVSFLLLALPLLMRGALRFRLHNTQYRGLRFDFTGSAGGAYRAYLPPMLTVLLPSALLAVDPSGQATAIAALLYLGFPLMHGTMKSYQHRHLRFGAADSSYSVPARRFYRPYLIAGLLMTGAMMALIFGGVVFSMIAKAAGAGSAWEALFPVMLGLVSAYFIFLVMGPYTQARFGNLVWSNTSFPGVEIRSTMSARAFARLQAVNVLLTLLTLGLYRPFAVVKVYRFRLENLSVHSAAGFEQAMPDAAPQRRGAAGDGVADFFDLDLSW